MCIVHAYHGKMSQEYGCCTQCRLYHWANWANVQGPETKWGPRADGLLHFVFAWVYSHHTWNCDFLAKLTINNRKFSSPTTLSIQYTVLPYSPNVHLLLIDELDSETNDFFLVAFGEISSFLIFEEKDSIFLNHFEDSFNEIQSSETIGEVYSGILSIIILDHLRDVFDGLKGN